MTIITCVILGIICAFLHKNKGYSLILGFCWGFFFLIIGLIVVLLETDKAERDANMANKKELSMLQWLGIFLGIGIAGIIILCLIINNI